MLNIKYYILKTPVLNNSYFNGGNGEAYNYEVEYYWTKEEAEKARDEKLAKLTEDLNEMKWWVEKYANVEHTSIEEATDKVTKEKV